MTNDVLVKENETTTEQFDLGEEELEFLKSIASNKEADVTARLEAFKRIEDADFKKELLFDATEELEFRKALVRAMVTEQLALRNLVIEEHNVELRLYALGFIRQKKYLTDVFLCCSHPEITWRAAKALRR